MTRQRWIAVLIGTVSAIGILFAMAPINQNFQREASFFGRVHWPLIWAMVLGIAVGGVVIAGIRLDPLISAIPAALIFLIFLPVFIDLWVPSWYPNWVRWRILAGFGTLPYAIVGALTAASLWPLLSGQARKSTVSRTEIGSPSQ